MVDADWCKCIDSFVAELKDHKTRDIFHGALKIINRLKGTDQDLATALIGIVWTMIKSHEREYHHGPPKEEDDGIV